ncbi:MAG TPA: nitrate reductase subunit alpha [Candidatus Acidoferrales bacterium]|nr:nitrate reductase subunit alpha [Candidatus Acidoferrales bacterium]
MSWIRDLIDPGARSWEDFYRNRWQHDRIVRSTHGVNCTGGCSWMIHVKNGIVTWEMQALDYPKLDPSLPLYEPRGCQRGITFSWYIYSPLRIKYPYARGVLLDLWREARQRYASPVDAWASLVEDDQARRRWQTARGKGGFRRVPWDEAAEIIAASMLHTARKYGPDRVVGFSPIPAMSMLSYAAGSRFLQLFGAPLLSFYDLYADFPPASPETWGEKTDVAESADWYNSKFIVTAGANLNMTRTPDVHFVAEARNNGSKLVVLSPDFSQVARYADWWIPVHSGMDGAFWMGVNHVILTEFHAQRTVDYFSDYLRRFSDCPFLVVLEGEGDACLAGRFLRAGRLTRYQSVENADWKLLVWDRKTSQPRMPRGSIGFRWQKEKGRWNLGLNDGVDGAEIDPALSLLDGRDGELQVNFSDPASGRRYARAVPFRWVETAAGRLPAATVYDLLMAQFGVARGLPGDYPAGYDDAESPYTPAWQEKYTGVGRKTVIQFAREFAGTAEKTRGKCTVIVGSGVNHWYHSNLHYRASIVSLVLCGAVGVNGGGLNHYTGQEKIAPAASWTPLAMALDWSAPPRLMNGPSYHYVHSDQWRYEKGFVEPAPAHGPFAREHIIDLESDAVRMAWLPFYPQFDANPLELVRRAEEEGARTKEEIIAWTVDRLRKRRLRFAVEDPDAPENWPRVWIIWRANAILSSAKGHEFFLKHYLGARDNAIAGEVAEGAPRDVAWRENAPVGKMDLVVDLNFRMDTSALYSDIVLPSASWYEKNDLNATDLHSYIHPLGEAVPPCWESKTDWDIFKTLARKLSEMSRDYFPAPFRDLVATPLLHDTPDELAQPEVRRWYEGECEPIPGKTMPRLSVVERDYPNLYNQFCSLGPRLRQEGVEDRGIHMPVADLYDRFAEMVPAFEWGGKKYPSLADPVDAANMVLFFAPETNGEVAWRGFAYRERETGLKLVDLAEPSRSVRYDFQALVAQPRRILTSPCWSGIINNGRPYSAYCQNVERGIPWRTLSGRQHLYQDHPAYLAFGENLPTFKLKISREDSLNLVRTRPGPRSLVVNCLTPHGKWHIHSTYADNLRMLTLSRGIEPFWLNDRDAEEIGVFDNDWVEAFNDNGVIVTRAAVSARIPRGIGMFYHAPERTVAFPKSPARGNGRGGGTNSITHMRLKPLLMAGGYAHCSWRFNDYGPPATDRDTYVVVRKLEGKPRLD